MNERDDTQRDEPRTALHADERVTPQSAEDAAAPSSVSARASETSAPDAAAPFRPASAAPGYRSGAASTWPRGSDPRRKSVALAVILSMMPGLGHVYLGYYQLGIVHFLIFAGLVTIVSSGPGGLEPLFGISLGFFILYNFVDAGRRAALFNQALDAQAVSELEPPTIPMNRGSAVGGFVLMLLGVLFLLHTRFDFDMYWVEEWWPLGLIALGAYLFIKDRQSRRTQG